MAALRREGDTQGFDAIIQTLLVDYYDKLYQHKADIRAESRVGDTRFRDAPGSRCPHHPDI